MVKISDSFIVGQLSEAYGHFVEFSRKMSKMPVLKLGRVTHLVDEKF